MSAAVEPSSKRYPYVFHFQSLLSCRTKPVWALWPMMRNWEENLADATESLFCKGLALKKKKYFNYLCEMVTILLLQSCWLALFVCLVHMLEKNIWDQMNVQFSITLIHYFLYKSFISGTFWIELLEWNTMSCLCNSSWLCLTFVYPVCLPPNSVLALHTLNTYWKHKTTSLKILTV